MNEPSPFSALSDMTLDELVKPIGATAFVEDYLLPSRHFLSDPNPSLVEHLGSIPELSDLTKLASRLEWVSLFGPEGFRARVPADTAVAFYEQGYTLYMTDVAKAIPGLRRALLPLVEPLGVHPGVVSVEAFASRKGAGASFHYDHDTNFQILLKGQKVWKFERNVHVANPLNPLHDVSRPSEEARAENLPLPTGFERPETVCATEGTTLFFPVGCWHETICSEDTFAINVVLKPPRWFQALSRAVNVRLQRDQTLRAPAFGSLGEKTVPALRDYAARQRDLAVRSFAVATESVTTAELGLWQEPVVSRWAPESAGRRLERGDSGPFLLCPEHDDGGFEVDEEYLTLVERIITMQGSFSLAQLVALEPGVPPESILAFVLDMLEHGYFRRG